MRCFGLALRLCPAFIRSSHLRLLVLMPATMRGLADAHKALETRSAQLHAALAELQVLRPAAAAARGRAAEQSATADGLQAELTLLRARLHIVEEQRDQALDDAACALTRGPCVACCCAVTRRHCAECVSDTA